MNIDALLTSKDPDELRSLALKLLVDLEQQTQRNQTQTCYIQQLEEALKNARQWRFGRKSEAFQGEQRGLFDEDIEADTADIEQQLATLLPEPKAPKPQTPKRQPLPPELPREEVRLAPASERHVYLVTRCANPFTHLTKQPDQRATTLRRKQLQLISASLLHYFNHTT